MLAHYDYKCQASVHEQALNVSQLSFKSKPVLTTSQFAELVIFLSCSIIAFILLKGLSRLIVGSNKLCRTYLVVSIDICVALSVPIILRSQFIED